MLTCQRCGRCYDMETTNVIDKLGLTGFRYDSLEARTVLRRTTDSFEPKRARARPSATSGRRRQETDMLARLAKKCFPRSLWVYHCNSGACNGCDIEILNILTPYYDVERFGIKLVGSPRHADVMLLSGAVTRPTLPLVKRAYAAMPAPEARLRHRLLRRRRRLLVRHLQRHRRRRHGRAGQLLHPRLPAAARGHHLRRRAGPRPRRQEGRAGRAQAGGVPDRRVRAEQGLGGAERHLRGLEEDRPWPRRSSSSTTTGTSSRAWPRSSQGNGYDVAAAFSGADGLKALLAERPDLVILDVMMETDTAGFEAADAIRSRRESVALPRSSGTSPSSS